MSLIDFQTNPTGTLSLHKRFLMYAKKPQNLILLVLGVILTITTLVPLFAILLDTVSVHQGTVDAYFAKGQTYTFFNWKDLFTGSLNRINLWEPLANTLYLAVLTCFTALAYGGIFAYLVMRTNMKFKRFLTGIFIFPYIMPQWTLAVVWQHLFNSSAMTGGADGIFASVFGINMPAWWCSGLFPSGLVLGLHYAPFAFILISAIFANMDANLEEAATILNTPRFKIFFRITMPLVKPAILSTLLLVFSGAVGSYPVPHYLNYTTLTTRYVGMNVNRAGQASILSIIMIILGVTILLINQRTTSGRKSYTTVTGKSGQSSLTNLGRFGKYGFSIFFVITTLFTAILPVLLFAMETFLPNPGDYSFLSTWKLSSLTTKWWTTQSTMTDSGTYGQLGILYNSTIWNAFLGTVFIAVACALIAGTIGTLVGYCVSKNRRSKFAGWVNSMAFLPYLLPSLAVGVSFFIFGSAMGIYDTYLLLIIAGTVKYIPFSSRSSLNSMLQLSGEIEEAAIIQNVPWRKRMTKIIIPIQKAAIISGFLLPFMTCLRELTLFMLLCSQNKVLTTLLGYFDEMGLYAFSSGINLILIVFIIVCNALVNKITGTSISKGIGG